MFPTIVLMNWHEIPYALREVGYLNDARDFFPGDRRYFKNPDVDPATPEWQGENVISLGDGLYYGHGIGTYKEDAFIKALNRNRRAGATRSAYLMNAAGRPDFEKLSRLYQNAIS
jgi:protein-glutamine gamma-glutamyltransferase